MIPAKPFYLIRHGETIANASQITAGGGLDSPLNDNGRAQAQAVANVIHTLELKPTKVLHSPMSRATDTAHIINQALQLEISHLDDFEEHRVGEWEGQPWESVTEQLISNVRPKDGENRDDFAERVKRVMNHTLPVHNDPVMLVAHGGTFHSIIHMHTGYDVPDVHITNCHLHYFEPNAAHEDFPWSVWQFDISEDSLIRSVAPFCSTQNVKKSA